MIKSRIQLEAEKERIEKEMQDNEDTIEDYEMWTKWYKPLEEAKGFTIHLHKFKSI